MSSLVLELASRWGMTVKICPNCAGRQRIVGYFPHADSRFRIVLLRCLACGEATEETEQVSPPERRTRRAG
jgi:hypothetical protein